MNFGTEFAPNLTVSVRPRGELSESAKEDDQAKEVPRSSRNKDDPPLPFRSVRPAFCVSRPRQVVRLQTPKNYTFLLIACPHKQPLQRFRKPRG